MNKHTISVLGILASIAIGLGMAAAGSDGGLLVSGLPLFAVCGLLAYFVQWIAFIPAFIFQTERYFDLLGSLTYISLAVVALMYSTQDPGAILVASMVIIWATRLGSFLFIRVIKDGHDARFVRIKPDFLRFLMTWSLQGLWVLVTFSAGLAALTAGQAYPLDVYVGAGCVLWLAGFIIEVVADQQKSSFRKDPNNTGKFIQHGIWAWSRHPNYFGEIVLWSGIAVAALPMLQGWQYLTLISPVFVFVLLTKISGVSMLEARANKKWGHQEDYKNYCAKTPVLLINPTLRDD